MPWCGYYGHASPCSAQAYRAPAKLKSPAAPAPLVWAPPYRLRKPQCPAYRCYPAPTARWLLLTPDPCPWPTPHRAAIRPQPHKAAARGLFNQAPSVRCNCWSQHTTLVTASRKCADHALPWCFTPPASNANSKPWASSHKPAKPPSSERAANSPAAATSTAASGSPRAAHCGEQTPRLLKANFPPYMPSHRSNKQRHPLFRPSQNKNQRLH